MNEILSGLAQGLREGPIVYATPLVAFWRCVNRTTSSLLSPRRNAIPQA